MEKISVIIPCKNEEHNIEEVLQSVQWADEIMVVDSFSADNTVEIAKKYTQFILVHEYNNPASQKNWAIPQASHQWILLVDADERVTPELKQEIQNVLNNSAEHAAYWIYRENYFMGRKMLYCGMQRDKVVRLFKRDHCRYEDKLVHEEIITGGSLGFLKHKLIHHSFKDMQSYLDKINRYTLWSALDYHKKTSVITGYHLVFKPFFKFFQFYILKMGFLDGFPGFVVSALASYTVLLRYVKLKNLRKTGEIGV